MKFLKDNYGYMTSILLVLLLIPVIFLLIITIEQNEYLVNKTADNIQSDKLNSITLDFQKEIPLITKETMNNLTLSIIKNKKPIQNSNKVVKTLVEEKVSQKQSMYKKNTGCIISCNITRIKQSNSNPFQLEVDYTIISKFNTKSTIKKQDTTYVDLCDGKYPVYDPLAILKTDAVFLNTTVNYSENLANNILLNNGSVYTNAVSGCIIKRCPYDEYTKHGHDNTTIVNCINNHYYHESHDGLCIFCRLENKTSCPDHGIETFIIPTQMVDNAPASLDHVLLNDTDGQYMGKCHTFDNNTVLYLDNGHKSKYGL